MSADYGGIKNHTDSNARHPSLAAINGVPHVAWVESGGELDNREIRVARLNGTACGGTLDGGERELGRDQPATQMERLTIPA